MYLGAELGLYRALHERRPLTPRGLAAAAGIDERHAETLHDLPHPVETLGAARGALSAGGAVLVADERVADAFSAPGDELERMMYGWSVTHCLPTQMVEQPSAALGTVMRAATVRELADRAGYARVDVLPVESDFFRLYRLQP